MAKLSIYEYPDGSAKQLWFKCPGCGDLHAYTVFTPDHANRGWAWNGSVDSPTFTPSLLCDGDKPNKRCHIYMTDGKIQYLSDCHHSMKGQTVDTPDWPGFG